MTHSYSGIAQVAEETALWTQAEATALAQPQIEGADIDCNFKGLDVLPLAAALDRGAAAKTQRLKLNGRTKFSVRLTPQQGPVEGMVPSLVIHFISYSHGLWRRWSSKEDWAICGGNCSPSLNVPSRAGAGKGRKQDTERPSAFSGDLSLDGLRVNQLKLSRNLTGSILLSNEQFQIRAKVIVCILCDCSGVSSPQSPQHTGERGDIFCGACDRVQLGWLTDVLSCVRR